MQLRPYQQDGKEQLYEAFKEGYKRVVYRLATGGGKSVCFTDLILDAVRFGLPVVLCVKRRQLISQASEHLQREGVKHGVYMAGHRRFSPKELVQICSIDTLEARNVYPNRYSNTLVIIDESHDCTPKSRTYVKFVEAYKDNHIVGFTATPFTDNSLFQKIICPIENYELREQGFLVPERTFVPNVIDISGVSTKRNGEFNEKELFEVSARKEIVGDFVRDWKLYANGRPTILFAVNVEHSKIIAEAFNAAGIRAIHSDAKTKSAKRTHNIDRLVKGEIDVLCNVDIFSTGVDIPSTSCIQLCRPTQSVVWHLQAIGRGLRPSIGTGKEDCLILDNAGNTLRHGTAYQPRESSLEPRGKASQGDDISIRACKQCFLIMEQNVKQCPVCGFQNPLVERIINHVEGDLVQYEMSEAELELMERKMITTDFHKLCYVAARNPKLKEWFVWQQLEKKYSVDRLSKYRDHLEIPPKIKDKL